MIEQLRWRQHSTFHIEHSTFRRYPPAMKRFLLLAALVLPLPLFAAPHIIDQKTFDLIAGEYSGERARALLQRISEFHRIQASPEMVDVSLKIALDQVRAAKLQGDLEYFNT